MNDKFDYEEQKREEAQKIADRDQALAAIADLWPGLWKSMYANLLIQGFSENQSMEILKSYIISQGTNGTKM